MVEGFEGEAGPVAAGDFGDGEEGTPVVGQAVVGAGRHFWVTGLQGDEVVFGPAGELLAENGFNFDLAAVETNLDLLGFGLLEEDDNGAVVQGGRQGADAGEDGRGEGVESADGVALAFATIGAGAAFVAGVEEAAQFFGAQGPGDHDVNEVEGGGFAALVEGRGEVQARTVSESFKGVNMSNEECDGMRRAQWQDNMEIEAVGDLVEDFGSVDGLRPGFDGREAKGDDALRLGVVVELGA